MKTPLAWLNLLHNKVRTIVALSGVAFAVVLIFMQLGFLGAVRTTATIVYNGLDFDIALRSREYLHLSDARNFPLARVYQAAAVPGVASARPFYIDMNQWRNPRTGEIRSILLLGANSEEPVFTNAEMQRKAALLVAPEFVLIDRKSRPEFGPRQGNQFGDKDIGVEAEVGGQRVRIAQHFAMGSGFAGDGAVLLNDSGFARVAPWRTREDVSLGLIKVAAGADADAVAARLRDALPVDVEVLTRGQVETQERNRWVWDTSLGVIFFVGVVLSLVVGMAIVYQVLSSDVANHMAEYATLKAMGYRDSFLAGVVLRQAVALAIVGFFPGVVLSQLLYTVTSYFANIPIEMTAPRMAGVLGLSVVMCVASGLGALRKIQSVEPAELF
jgi:putative ABC transport system permease protein